MYITFDNVHLFCIKSSTLLLFKYLDSETYYIMKANDNSQVLFGSK